MSRTRAKSVAREVKTERRRNPKISAAMRAYWQERHRRERMVGSQKPVAGSALNETLFAISMIRAAP